MSTPRSSARAVADVGAGTIVATVDIEAPPERVWAAITRASEVTQWWGSPEAYRTTEWVLELQPRGRFRAGGVGQDGRSFAVEGEVLEVDAPRRLVHTWRPDWDGGHATTVRYTLEPIAGGTRITVHHQGFAGRADACKDHAQGWERVLGWLGGHVAAAGGAGERP